MEGSMSTLIFHIDKMGEITVVNHSSAEIQVSITTTGGDHGDENWFPLKARGGRDTWNRNKNQVIRFVRSVNAGVLVEIVLGVPGSVVNIG